MTYAERVALEMAGNNADNIGVMIACRLAAQSALDAIAATGCKVVERKPTEAIELVYLESDEPDWQSMFDEAPNWPGDAE